MRKRLGEEWATVAKLGVTDPRSEPNGLQVSNIMFMHLWRTFMTLRANTVTDLRPHPSDARTIPPFP